MTTITTRLIGGLGNQMFQYAAARALALRCGAEVRLDLSSFKDQPAGNTPRRYELDTFSIAATFATEYEPLREERTAVAVPGGAQAWLGRVIGRQPNIGGKTAAVRHYREPHFHFDTELSKQPLPLLIDGYWQSERYFCDAALTIRADLTPTTPLEPYNAATAAHIDEVEAVSVHVRRGDYVTNAQANAFHGTCSLDYYRAAVDFVGRRAGRPHLFVFSDDPNWTRDNLRSDLSTTYVTANPPDCGYRDMQLMSRCRHHIIANSSFSWWGAWLNPRPDKIVVAPAVWFAKPGKNTRDLLPTAWVRL